MDDIGARLETSPRRSLIRLTQETIFSEKSTSRATKLLKVRPYKTKDVYLQGSLKYEAYKKNPHIPEEPRNDKHRKILTISENSGELRATCSAGILTHSLP